MPVTKIYIAAGKTAEHKKQVLRAVKEAVVAAFQLSPDDMTQMLSEFDKNCFIDRRGGDFTYVEIVALTGRSKEAKRKLYRHVVDKICAVTNIDPSDVLTMLYEIPRDNCGVRGGHMASDVQLGFKIEV